jgi:hypothetical protein
VPSDIKQLTAGRQLTGLRQVLDCPATPTTLRQGPAADTDGLRLSCGSVLDYRPAEQLLQSHADLWLPP